MFIWSEHGSDKLSIDTESQSLEHLESKCIFRLTKLPLFTYPLIIEELRPEDTPCGRFRFHHIADPDSDVAISGGAHRHVRPASDEILVALLAPPVQDGRDPATQEGRALGRSADAGQASKGFTPRVVDPPAVAVADQLNQVARPGGGDGGQRRITRPQASLLAVRLR